MDLLNGIFTITLFGVYLSLWYIKRREMLKSEGVDVNVTTKSTRPVLQYFASLEKIMRPAIFVIIALHIIAGEGLIATNRLNVLDNLTVKIAGFVLGWAGLSLCRIAQVTLGRSWRVGIDEEAKTGLITHGIYKYIRNPTYTGLFILCTGIWLINPTLLYLFWMVVFFLMMEFQVRSEEEYLEDKYGEAYKQYCKKTKRYFPAIY